MKARTHDIERFAARRLRTPLAWMLAAALAFATPVAAFAEEASSGGSDTRQQAQQGQPPSDAGGGQNGQGGQPPSKPDGEQQGGEAGGEPPSKPNGEGDADGGGGQAPGGGGGANTQSYDYSGSLSGELSVNGDEKTSEGESVSATEADQNAVLVSNGGTLKMTGAILSKSGGDGNGDNCNFYGLNSILLSVNEGSTAYVSDTSLCAESEGSNGIFATDSGTVFANNDTITTSADKARGLDATYSGIIVANQMTIETQGRHCAGVATDRGGGDISVTNSTLSTAGSGSPLLYSTGNIEVDNVSGTATGSQIAGMEGLNTILISNSTLESTTTDRTASDPVADGIIIYQSTSGDADTSTGAAARFQATDSTLKSAIQSGSMFYTTNTTADIVLKNTTLDYDSTKASLLIAQGNDSNNWGSAGKNGATVNFTGIQQTLDGNISADTISQAHVYLTAGTTWTGAASIEENASGGDAVGDNLAVNVDGTSTWVVTADSTVSSLNVAEGGKVVDASGNTATIVANGTTVVEGSGSVTVTLTGAFGTEVSTGDANEVQNATISRANFDAYYATSTTFGGNGGTSAGSGAGSSTASSFAAKADEYDNLALPLGLGAVVVLSAGLGAFVYTRKKNKVKGAHSA